MRTRVPCGIFIRR